MSFPRSPGLAIVLAVLVQAPARAADWNQWRGPGRDGIASGFTVPRTWPKTLKKQWQITVGEGHSSPVVADGKIYQFARQGDDEVVLCLDGSSGKERWKQKYPAPYKVNSAARDHGKGPKATPVVHDGKVYTFGISGILSCWEAASGKMFWQKQFGGQFKTTSPLYGTAASPLIDQGLCIAHVGGHNQGALTAFDARTGEVKWAYTEDGPGYSSPIVVTLAGQRQVVTQTQSHVVGVSVATGKLLWKLSFTTAYDQNSVTPVLYKDLLIYSGYGQPTVAIRVEKSGDRLAAREVWSNRQFLQYMSSPVLKDNLLFGMTDRRGGQIFCLNADTGRTQWQNQGRMGDNVSLVRVGEVLLLLSTESRLSVIKASGSGYEPVAEYRVADTPTWAHPVPDGKRILIKDANSLASWSVEE